MIIGIDASALTLPHPTGVQRYTEHIIRALLAINNDHTYRLYTPSDLPTEFRPYQVILKSPRFWTQIRLPFELWRHKPDVFFQPSYMLPPFLSVPSAIMVHDLGWIKHPEGYSASQLRSEKWGMRRLKTSSARILVPSKSARSDCIKLLHIAGKRIDVIAEALVPLPHPMSNSIVQKYDDKTIILSVGRLEARKNTLTLVKAFESLCAQGQLKKEGRHDLALVLIGQAGFGYEQISKAITSAQKRGLTILERDDADDAELASWFAQAKAFVYPSLYEGFGLPILQAFQAHVPVVTTDVSSIPEVGGDAVQYVHDLYDEDELATAINSVIDNPVRAKSLVEHGRKQLQKFSWEQAAKETLSVLEQR